MGSGEIQNYKVVVKIELKAFPIIYNNRLTLVLVRVKIKRNDQNWIEGQFSPALLCSVVHSEQCRHASSWQDLINFGGSRCWGWSRCVLLQKHTRKREFSLNWKLLLKYTIVVCSNWILKWWSHVHKINNGELLLPQQQQQKKKLHKRINLQIPQIQQSRSALSKA